MPKLLIIADDFTGSLDTAVQFAKRGADTLVICMKNGKADIDLPCEVLAVNTDSRHIGSELAYERVAGLVKGAYAAGFTHIFKKTDSTLRGNIGSELAALLENSGERELVFMPAYPKTGRFTIKGRHFVNDVPLTQTAFAADPFNPVRHDEAEDIIHEQTNLPVRKVFYDGYDKLLEAPSGEKTILLVDGRCDEELTEMGRFLKEADKLRCLAGCAGLAEQLPELLGFKRSNEPYKKANGNKLLVSGSVNPLAQSQIAYAIEKCGYADCSLSLEQKLADNIESADAEGCLAMLKSRGKVALWSEGSKKAMVAADEEAVRRGIPLTDIPNRVAGNIGALAGTLVNAGKVQSLIVFGGDTLIGISEFLNCSVIKPITELSPGVVLARFLSEHFGKLDVVTKAGGFGEEDVIARIEELL